MSSPAPLAGLGVGELKDRLTAMAAPAYRADQIRLHAWRGSASGFSTMANLPAGLRSELNSGLLWSTLDLVGTAGSDRGLTEKLLLRCNDGQEIETVMIRHPGGPEARPRNTVCVSSQVGCAIGCVFCATGQLGLRRNLSAAEIVDQVLAAARRWGAEGRGAPTNVVYMGMGEPLQNYAAVTGSIRLLAEWGISTRRVVVSTSGLVPQMERLALEGLPIRLAVSLHAASDRLRDQLVPLNRRYPISSLVEAAQHFVGRTGRRVSLEYVLMAGVNDGVEDAAALRRLAATVPAHVNLIPMNPIPGSALSAPPLPRCRAFAEAVGPRATIRFSRGDRAQAACGQLRATMESDSRRLAKAELAVGPLTAGAGASSAPPGAGLTSAPG